MRYGKEFKVGISILAAALIFILGVRYFEDLPLFTGTYDLNTSFDHVNGLTRGNPVRVHGVTVGAVDDVRLNDEANKVAVRFHVNDDVAVPDGSHTKVAGFAALGNVFMEIEPGPAGNPTIPRGGFVPGATSEDLMSALTNRAPDYANQLGDVLQGADTALSSINALLSNRDSDLNQTLYSFRSSATTVDRLLRAEQARIAALIDNLESFSGDLNRLSDQSSDTLAISIQKLNRVMDQMQRATADLETSMAGLDTVIVRIERGDGTVGKLINDPSIYQKLDSSLTSLNKLLQSFEKDPGRFLKEMHLVDIF